MMVRFICELGQVLAPYDLVKCKPRCCCGGIIKMYLMSIINQLYVKENTIDHVGGRCPLS